ncbi:hypothetical protein [Isoalcanivorax indicus]|uniref:hypothetical protein n=1 Tax=Isoalcanivorax indicus TaxID=2202653 RepID=UPI001B87A0A9|nr:hypothetical protein [Isoalcanivorax indicus]
MRLNLSQRVPLFRSLHLAGLLAGVMLVQGCSIIYKTTGDILVNYGRSEMTPYLLTYTDVGMACATGEGLTPFLVSFESVHANPTRLAVLTNNMAAACADQRALDAELRYNRAMNRGDTAEAQDARTEQKQHAEVAARRLYESYQRAVKQYGEVDVDQDCPRLRSDFDELVFMVGQISGSQALLHDATADVTVGVPRDIAAKAERAATCLDNDKWWGVPQGIRATLWTILPMLAPEGADNWAELEGAVRKGFDAGVRLNSALYVVAAYSVGNDEHVRRGIRDFANYDTSELDPDNALLDAIAGEMVKGVSDRMWTENTGQRTPYGRLGTFWDDRDDREQIDIDDLL